MKSGRITFDLQAIWGSADDSSRLHELGTGTYVVEIWARKIGAAEFKKEERVVKDAEAEAERAREQRCSQCVERHKSCLRGHRRPSRGLTCFGEFEECSPGC